MRFPQGNKVAYPVCRSIIPGMKLRITALFAALALILASCDSGGGNPGGGNPGHSGDSSDPIPIAEGAWADCSLSAAVVSGASTDELYFTTTVSTPGDYVVEYRSMPSTTQAGDFLWLIDPDNHFSLASGQEAADFYHLASAGSCTFLVRNDNPTAAMTCQVRLVLLSASGFYIPSEGSLASPVPLILGVAHAGKVGLSGDDPFAASYYSFRTGAAGTYTVTAMRDDEVGMAGLLVYLYWSSTFSGYALIYGVPPFARSLDADTEYFLLFETYVGGSHRPTYSLTVTGP
jgi:hypothetical protein